MRAGIEGYTNKNTINDGTTTWTGYTGGKLVIQKGKEVWNLITRDRAVIEASKLYNKEENNVISKLCSSYAWDTALKFIQTQNSTYPMNSEGGNYKKEDGTYKLEKTGYHAICNIYDMGGNVWEWTTENYSVEERPCSERGGAYASPITQYPGAFRGGNGTTNVDINLGFRVTLYM